MSNNSKNQKNSGRQQGKQIAAVCLVVCFVAALAIAGTYIFNRNDSMGSQASTEGTDNSAAAPDASKEASQNNSADSGEDTDGDTQGETTAETASDTIQNEAENTDEDAKTEEGTGSTTQSGNDVSQQTSVAPQGELSLAWPVDGSVLMSYSMDKTVFFKTLNQYKYNPAMLIGGEVGDEVKSSASGTISSIEVAPQTGTTVTMNIGNGYAVVYGQLKEVAVEEGDYLDAGELLGYLSEPTKYYTEEGCNLYYQVLENGNPVNPMDYLDSEQ